LKKVDVLQMDTLNIIDMTTSASDDDELDILNIKNNQKHTTININTPDLIINNYYTNDIAAATNHQLHQFEQQQSQPQHQPQNTSNHTDVELGLIQNKLENIQTNNSRQNSKLSRQRTSINQQQSKLSKDADTLLMETSLTIIEPISPIHFQPTPAAVQTSAIASSPPPPSIPTSSSSSATSFASAITQLNPALLPPTTSIPLSSIVSVATNVAAIKPITKNNSSIEMQIII
jgi:hypothetical protein